MKRRQFVRAGLVGLAGVVCSGHTPFQQWTVYRQRHLLILTDRSDPPSYPLGKRVAAVLATHLPASRARVTRAPHTERIASLISSKQLDVALISPSDAAALTAGLPPFDWTDRTLTPGVTPVRGVHLTELRAALAEAYAAAGRQGPVWTNADPAGAIVIRAAHLMELRDAVLALE